MSYLNATVACFVTVTFFYMPVRLHYFSSFAYTPAQFRYIFAACLLGS